MTEQTASPQVYSAQFATFKSGLEVQALSSMELLLDIPLRISVELGRAETTVKGVLDLGPGSIIELNKMVGEPVDMLVNGRLFAQGEVVVVEENFAIRITDILSLNGNGTSPNGPSSHPTDEKSNSDTPETKGEK